MGINHAARGFLRQDDGRRFLAVNFDGQGTFQFDMTQIGGLFCDGQGLQPFPVDKIITIIRSG
jgi:hypothetical protein